MLSLTPCVFGIGIGIAVGLGLGLACRAVLCRILATLSHSISGFQRLPMNWRENNCLTDLWIPAELLPGVRKYNKFFAVDGFVAEWDAMAEVESSEMVKMGGSAFMTILGATIFVPVFICRLSIKGTAWFWWPLAYLLKPVRKVDAEAAQRQELCWPLTDPMGKSVILFSVILALGAAMMTWLAGSGHVEIAALRDLPLPVRVLTGLGWSRWGLWHAVLGLIGLCGWLMLMLAGHAQSQHETGNWPHYERRPQHLVWMTALRRLRNLATIALLLLALGSLLLLDETWPRWLHIPASWLAALEGFYRA